MSRVIQAVMTAEQRADVVKRLEKVAGIVGVSVLVGASRTPAGDIVSVQVSNDAARDVLKQLGEAGVLRDGSAVLSEPTALIVPAGQELLARESNEAAWEEMAGLLRRDTNVGPNFLVLMAVAGGIAAVGIVEDKIHIVVGANLLAPGFEPILRIVFGGLTGGRGTGVGSGLWSTLSGYAALAVGAGMSVLVLSLLNRMPPAGLSSLPWVRYWTSIGTTGVFIALLAGGAGATIVASRRDVFAAGVMVALALVPGIAIGGMGVALGELAVAAKGLLRWATDAACVVLAGGLTLGLKRWFIHRCQVED